VATGLADPCSRCGRTLLELRAVVGKEALRGSAPLCSIPACPLVGRVAGLASAMPPGARDLQGPSPPAVFVGRHGYPNVAVGPLLPPSPELDPRLSATPRDWLDLDIAATLAMRARLVRSKSVVAVDAPRDASRALDVARELAMSESPVDTEVTLAKPRALDLSPRVDGIATPMGPSVDVVRARLTASPKVPRRVDAAVGDVHATASDVAWEMYDAGVSPYHISRVLSVGLLGEAARRRLVPTRWSITATDDLLGKELIESVKTMETIGGIEYRAASLHGNHFHVILLPRAWSYEMIEAWATGRGFDTAVDREGHSGRTAYASNITGAYYAARLSILEHLRDRARQAAGFVYREITEDYWAPLGVWVIREGVRLAMESKPLAFGEVPAAVAHVLRRSRCRDWPREAKLLQETATQRTLRDFLDASGARRS